ncbi:hypothetical protein [Luteimonas lutimaris]|uniref:Uncharacterized protein n=1 Tax=Luteimonas lutimaris TaxID=698645 RepID=A0ABP7MP93_9GAMM
MTTKSTPAAAALALALTLAISACGGQDDAARVSHAANNAAPAAPDAAPAPATETGAAFTPPTLSDGPDACFKAIAAHLGAETKVSEILAFYSAGSAINPDASKPQGQMTTCTVKYQDPDDPRKLAGTSMDMRSGQFRAPRRQEIMVMGNPADFDLEDHLIPLSQVDAAALTGIMDAQEKALGGVYASYAWTGVRLSPPGAFSDVHTLRLDVTGRLASNDIKTSGYASVSVDGKKITSDHLLPR